MNVKHRALAAIAIAALSTLTVATANPLSAAARAAEPMPATAVGASPGGAQAAADAFAAAASFSFTQYATVSPAAGWSFVAGNFAGDNRADVAGYHPSNGSLWVGRNTGS